METQEINHDRQLEKKKSNKLKGRAIDQLAIGAIILLWSSLLILKQIGLIDSNVSTWPFALAAFGILLVVGGIYRLITSRTQMKNRLPLNSR